MTEKVATNAALEWVPLNLMRVSSHCQRKVNPQQVARIAAHFDPDLLGLPVLSMHAHHYLVLDGQQRIAAFREWHGTGWETQQMQCHVYRGLSEQQEADMFLRLQSNRVRVSAYEEYRVGINAGREDETAVEEQVRAAGLKTGTSKSSIHAVSSLLRVYRRSDAETLGKTLRIIRDAYGENGFGSETIDGLGLVCQRYNGQLDELWAIQRLGSALGGLNGLLNTARTLRLATGNSPALCVAAAIVDTLNKGRSGKKLTAWWKA